jgi:hypothetical protein
MEVQIFGGGRYTTEWREIKNVKRTSHNERKIHLKLTKKWDIVNLKRKYETKSFPSVRSNLL